MPAVQPKEIMEHTSSDRHRLFVNSMEYQLGSCPQNKNTQTELVKALTTMQKEKAALEVEVQMRSMEVQNELMRKDLEFFQSQMECVRLEQQLQRMQTERRKIALKAQIDEERPLVAGRMWSHAHENDMHEDFTEQAEPTPKNTVWSSNVPDSDGGDMSRALSPYLPLSVEEMNSEHTAAPTTRKEEYQSHKLLPDTSSLVVHQQSTVRLDKPRRQQVAFNAA